MFRQNIFILGAGFSRYAGVPLTRDLRHEVFEWLKRNTDDARIQPHMRALPGRPEFPDGKFTAGLECVDRNQGFEELLIDLRAASTKCPPAVQTSNVLRRACVRLLWEKQPTNVPEPYLNFARHAWRSLGVISFNWDIVCELALQKAERTWNYVSGSNVVTPIIKPHGSINWVNHLQSRDGRIIKNPPEFIQIGAGLTISWQRETPFSDPLLTYDDDKLRQVLFPGDPEVPNPEEGEAAKRDAIQLWKATENLVSTARQVVFIGYSLPTYDQYAKEVLQRICAGKEIVVCNPSPEVIDDFAKVFANSTVIPMSTVFEKSLYARP